MSDYLVIDADSHVEEPEEAWNYLQEKYRESAGPSRSRCRTGRCWPI
jgi:hypothetical protein